MRAWRRRVACARDWAKRFAMGLSHVRVPAPPNILWLSSFFDRGRSLMRANHETTVLIRLNLIDVGI